jgi:putative ABC transport system substrate-binding protein
MDRRRFLLTSLAGALVGPPAAGGQQAQKGSLVGIPRVGYVSPAPGPNVVHETFISGLREAGYSDGQNVVVDRRYMGGREKQYDQVMAELDQQKVSVIVAAGPPAALAAKRMVKTVPVVFTAVGDPVGIGLVHSLSKPGGNMTGVAFDVTPEIAAKRLELLKAAVPPLSHVAALWSSTDPVGVILLRHLESAAQLLGVNVKAFDVRTVEDFDPVFEAILKNRHNGLLVIGGPVNVVHRKRIITFASTHAIPAISISRDYAEEGGLMSYGPSFGDQGRHAAKFAARILRGAKPSELPVEQPTRLELVVNLNTARALGLTIPPSLLLRADQVIE